MRRTLVLTGMVLVLVVLIFACESQPTPPAQTENMRLLATITTRRGYFA